MYIKIGKTDIKYNSDVDDYMIFSEIPDSQLSYEKPILVRTKDELDIWFGRNFKDRDYFDELIKKGITLYLYKPTKENNTHDIDDYIDIETYYIFPEIFYYLPDVGEVGNAYYLTLVDEIKHYYTFGLKGDIYSWIPVISLEGYEVDENRYKTIYDLPHIGSDTKAYYVENIPQNRYWYIYENNTWVELGDRDLKNYIPYRQLFPDNQSLPLNGIYKYRVLFDDSWYIWSNSIWKKVDDLETIKDIQEFPMYFDKVSDLPEVGNNYKYYVNGVWYIWLGESWTPEDIFPQNLDNISESLNNRDTLMISKPDNDDMQEYYIPYSHPEFRLFGDNHLGVFTREYDIDYSQPEIISLDSIEDIVLNYKTLAIKLTYTSETLDQGYIIIESKVEDDIHKPGYNYCFFTGEDPSTLSASYYTGERVEINTVLDLIEQYEILGYKTVKTGNNEYLIYSNKLFDFTEFYTYKNIGLKCSFDDTENILTEFIKESKGIEFYSKTVGTDFISSENNIESLISVKIEPTEYERYIVTIGRYDYTEIFEGSLFTGIGEERLDSIINNKSKLVRCNISGLKNFIKPRTYQGKVGSLIETSDFKGTPNILLQHYYAPPIGQTGIKYKVYDGLWKTWDPEQDSYINITRLSDNFYDLTEEILNYPDLEALYSEEGASSLFEYYVESEDKWYTWDYEEESWVVIEKKVLPTDEYSIKVERLGYEEYALYIIIGDLNETYTGNLFKLQEIINESSKIFKDFQFKNLCNQLRTGTFYLRRGKNEIQTPDMYLKSLGCLFDTQIDNIWPDYFLVPDIKKYTNNLGEIKNIESDIFLEHAKNFNCQFLIQNNNPEYKLAIIDNIEDVTDPDTKTLYSNKEGTEYWVSFDGQTIEEFIDQDVIEETLWGGDFIFNYTKDTSNYLVYFFRPISIYGKPRPAYYIFLDGLLKDIYSYSETSINYDSPLQNDPYELDSTEENLEKYKSNFLINNNHMFYYKKYFNGSSYYSTIWMRFVLGKIYRELHKNRWMYLSEKSIGTIETNIENTFSRIQSMFSIVRFINITKFTPRLSENYLELSIDTYVNDLMNNNMTLDITVNYNELNNTD